MFIGLTWSHIIYSWLTPFILPWTLSTEQPFSLPSILLNVIIVNSSRFFCVIFLAIFMNVPMQSYLTTGAVTAPITLVSLLITASLSYRLTVILLFIVLPSAFLLVNRYHPSIRYNSNFYISWTISSYIFSICVFEFEVLPYLEILFYENALFLIFSGLALTFAIITRQKASAQLDETYIPPKIFKKTYCCWLKCTIDSSNLHVFIWGCIITIAALIYNSHLMLTTVCHVQEVEIASITSILVPHDCSDVYLDYK